MFTGPDLSNPFSPQKIIRIQSSTVLLLVKFEIQVGYFIIMLGRVLLTSMRLYFQAYNNLDPEPVIKIKLSSIRR